MSARRWVGRLGSLVLVTWLASAGGYLLLRAAPGDPVDVLMASARDPRPERRAELRRQYALDVSPVVGVLRFGAAIAKGDLGRSFVDGRPVLQKLLERLPVTLALALGAVAVAALGGVLIGGVMPAGRRGRVGQGRALGQLAVSLLYATPVAGLAVIALAWGAPYGRPSALVPAALCVALPLVASTARQVATALAATLQLPFVTTLRARGLSEAAVRRRAIVASLGPAVALLFGQFPALLSGALVVEVLFGVPGLGLLGHEALLQRDHPVVLGLLVVSSVTALVASWAGDAVRRALDPRLALRDDAETAEDPAG